MTSTSLTENIDFGMDGHVHTHLCNHAHGTMEEYVQFAIKNRLHTICFLEHFETGITYFQRSWLRDKDFTFYFKEGERLRRIYGDTITILLGVEAGYNPESAEAFEEMVTAYPWDRIGLSCHFLRVGEEHLNLLSRRQEGLTKLQTHGADRVFAAYFTALIEALNMVKVDVVCHLDAAMRHLRGLQLGDEEYKRIDTILAVMQKKGVALEINTSGFEIRGEPFPNTVIIKKAYDLGIGLQLGSDAHSPDQVGRFFPHCASFLQSILPGTP